MKSERQIKIGLLARASRGKALLQSHLAALSTATKCDVVAAMLTDLVERDLALEGFRDGYQNAKRSHDDAFSKTWTADRRGLVFLTIDCFADLVGEEVILITKESEYCGAVRLKGRAVFHHWEELLELDKDAVMVLSSDHSQGLLLDLSADDPHHCFELTVWGNRWAPAASRCFEKHATSHDSRL